MFDYIERFCNPFPVLSQGESLLHEMEMRTLAGNTLWVRMIAHVSNPAEPTAGICWLLQHRTEVRRVQRGLELNCVFKRTRRGRPGPDTAYRKVTKRRFEMQWSTDEEAVAYDRRSDGMYPFMTNDRKITAAQVLEAHKGQPMNEKRFEQIKTVHEIGPVFLKEEGRIKALFILYVIELLVQALVERELRRGDDPRGHPGAAHLPQARQCAHPTTEQVLRLFSLAEWHQLMQQGRTVQVFPPSLTELLRQVLALLGVPPTAFTSAAAHPASVAYFGERDRSFRSS